MKKLFIPISILIILCSWSAPKTLKGTWQFAGGIYNGKRDTASTDYKLQRQYDKAHFNAFIIEPNEKPIKYQGGDYVTQADTCFETETFTTQPSTLTGKTIHYHMQLRNDTLVLSGKLPKGLMVEEYWKKVM
ncbi:hypothetical protein [Mucilaginibacter polytrichastri]|uniref:Lipocalin-like domain-containing protein n=1 Tax=Mucilaginibacter polytrichastri TaxID=1302689 RepID=A0A1Q5ZX56_9SPHI|nr:hypothetical protein [Mucilaginibacter polytrichastri]OKS86322.1 hypothetical protein RG47T_1776 [Mucilaginibacter polytrichastri]SFT21275.1 hypothetical protein SAMN04487890_11786 [Mucilaginibacter polytrichastri]